MRASKRVIILGGGISGLAAGWHLARQGGFEVKVLERAADTGGVCGSFKHNGFTLDYGAHKFYSLIPGIMDEVRSLMGDGLLELNKQNRIFLRGRLVDYPLSLGNLARVLGPGVFLKLGLGYAIGMAKGLFSSGEPANYEQFMINRFGRPAYELVFEPLADKVWGEPSTLHPDMARTRIPAGSGLEVILKLLGLKKETKETSAPSFLYPRQGFGALASALAQGITKGGGQVLTGVEIERLVADGETISGVEAKIDGEATQWPCDLIISTIPLKSLGGLLYSGDQNPPAQVLGGLEFRHVIMVYLFIKRPLVTQDQWIFFPERRYIFSRLFEQKQMNPELGPTDRTALCCDFTCRAQDPLWQATDADLVQRCLDGVVEAGFVKQEECYDSLVVRVPEFYPRYGQNYQDQVRRVTQSLTRFPNLILSGRLGLYNYNNADHCLDMGRIVAQRLSQGAAPAGVVQELMETVSSYRIVD
ncbi:MAG: FAD-dependent oxidoreductase [Desulfarculaceae bacterium]